LNIPIVYEDNWILIVDKPAGLLSVPTPKNEARTLTSILNQDLEEKNKDYKVYPCHRLDRDTSGLIIYAKSRSIQEKIIDAFRRRLVHKKYIAFVHGTLSSVTGQINSAIEGKNALTKYRLLKQKSGFSIVEVSPVTGRTNQIRIHFKRIGHPLVGEDKFAFRKDFALKAKRVCLHAGYLEFLHPQTAKNLKIELPLAEDLQNFLAKH